MLKLSKKAKIWIGIAGAAVVVAILAIILVPRMTRRPSRNGMEMMFQNNNSTISLTKRDLLTSISATGSIASAKTKTVSANVNGAEVSAVHVSVGNTVKKGAKLVTFDTTSAKENLADAKENLSDVTSDANDNISKAQDSVEAAKKAYEEAKKSADEKQISEKKSAYDNAKDQLSSAKKNKTRNVKEAQKKVDDAQETLDHCVITAPMAGMVTSVSVEAGDAYTGGTLVQIDDVSGYMVTTSVDEYDISDVKEGQRVVILTDATGDDELEGEITFVSPIQASSSNAMMGASSGGYEVKIALAETDERLRIGMTARCSIILEEATDVFAVPYDAIHDTKDGGKVIYVGTAEEYTEMAVTVGMESDYYVEISGEGLEEGLRVVLPTDEISTGSSDDEAGDMDFFGGMGGGMPGAIGGDMPSGMNGGDRGGSGMPTPPGQ